MIIYSDISCFFVNSYMRYIQSNMRSVLKSYPNFESARDILKKGKIIKLQTLWYSSKKIMYNIRTSLVCKVKVIEFNNVVKCHGDRFIFRKGRSQNDTQSFHPLDFYFIFFF